MSVPSNLIPTRMTQLPTPSATAEALQDALVMITFGGVSYKIRAGDLIAAATGGTFSAGVTGLTPATPASGDVTLGGTLNVEHGGTGASTAAEARANLGAAASGANTDISSLTGLTGGVETADYLQLDVNGASTPGVGKLQWDATWNGPQIGMGGGNVNLQIGQETLIYVYNNTGSTLTDGQVVYVTGSQGQRVTVALAQANSDSTSAAIIGMVTEPIAHNTSGFVTTQGMVSGINTNGAADGAVIWLSPTTAGDWTTTKPTAPEHLVMVGYVVKGGSGGAGSVYIHPQNGYELDELHDVRITARTAYNLLRVNSANTYWENIPGPTGSIVGTTDAQALSNKTYTGNWVASGQLTGGYLSNGTNTAAQQLASYAVVKNTISASTTLTTTVAGAGSCATVLIVSSGTTSRTVTFGSGFLTTGTLSTGTTSGKTFAVSFVSDGSTMIETGRTAAM